MNPARARRRATRGFTLLEMVVAMALGTIVFAAALTGIVFLQKSYAATEQYAVSLADQTRLLDSLNTDLRRAMGPPQNVADVPLAGSPTNTLTLYLPNYYASAVPNSPRLNLSAAYYDLATSSNPNTRITVVYRLRASLPNPPPRTGVLFNVITRQEGGGSESPVAAGMSAFPDVTFTSASGVAVTTFRAAIQAQVTLSFRPMFHTLSTPDNNLITLHSQTFLRNNDSRSE